MANIPKIGIGIKFAKSSPIIPYLMFSNDRLIVYKANRKAVRHIKTILDNYCKIPGHLVNFHK